MTNIIALFDACVLYPAPLRDLLMRLAITDLFQARWTNEIHDEWTRSVLANRPDLTHDQLERTRRLMNSHVPDCVVTGHAGIIDELTLPDRDDRHVLAAAIHARASVLVTYNLKDFPSDYLATHGVVAQHPDKFIAQFLVRDPVLACGAVKLQRSALKHPPQSVEDFLATLARQRLPETVRRLQEFRELI